jgi:pimeloyl-ACP methyl ester carboxylesterase
VLAVPGFVSHLDMWWDAPTDRLVQRLASFSRLILFDKRGMGLSDRPPHIDAEQWVEGHPQRARRRRLEKAMIFGISVGAPTAALFAARHPERLCALILYGGYARFLLGEGYEFGAERAAVDSFIGNIEVGWGTGVGPIGTSRAACARRSREVRLRRRASGETSAKGVMRQRKSTSGERSISR